MQLLQFQLCVVEENTLYIVVDVIFLFYYYLKHKFDFHGLFVFRGQLKTTKNGELMLLMYHKFDNLILTFSI